MKQISDFKPGDKVTYYPAHTRYNPMHKDTENGIVSSVTETAVFVKYIRNGILQSTAENTPIEYLIKGHHKPVYPDDYDIVS